jgi:thiol-disulfide isomerase/thioredoxin
MESKRKISRSEIVLRVILFIILSCSAIFKLIAGFDNFEIALMETGEIGSWLESMYVLNTLVFLEISCAIFALFGSINWFQKASFALLFVLYTISIIENFGITFYQDYSFIFWGFDIFLEKEAYFFGGYYLNISLLFTTCILFVLLSVKKITSPLLKWPIQLVAIVTLFASYLLLGSLNLKQLNLKTEEYSAGITNWNTFETALAEQHPEVLKGEWVIAFFSTTCDHCKKYARKISFSPNHQNVLYVFWSSEEQVEKFKKEHNVSGNHLILPQNVIMNIAGQEYPVLFTFKDGKPEKQFVSSEFSYAEMDRIFQ